METTRIIEAYLDGNLGNEERRSLEERSAGDEEFRGLIKLHKEVNESIRDKDLHLFHNLIKKIQFNYFKTESHSSLDPQSTRLKPWRKNLLRIAAAIILIIGTGVILKYSFVGNVNPEKLYNQFYTAYDADGVMRSAQTERTLLEDALFSYGHKDYTAALEKLEIIIAGDQTNYVAWFYKGLTCMETNTMEEAIYAFRTIPSSWNSPFIEHRDWYLALALLHDEKLEEAASAFRQIADNKGYYAGNAEKIFRKLRS
jgi:hypothetical protein